MGYGIQGQGQTEGIRVPPCFIIVCQNTAISKLVYDYISGFQPAANPDGTLPPPFMGALPLFSNYDTHGEPLARPRTLLIDSEQLESGEALDDNFRSMADTEIEQFRRFGLFYHYKHRGFLNHSFKGSGKKLAVRFYILPTGCAERCC